MRKSPVAEPDLLQPDRPEEQALAQSEPSSSAVAVFERLARDPAVDVEKLERLIAMQERILAHNAKAAFDAAYARMQAELPEIAEKGQILVKGQLRSTYAKLEDIHSAVKPILKAFGFAIRHRTEWPEVRDARDGVIIRIVGILSHEQGHSEESIFEAPLDKSEYRTDIQSMGSTVSYGRRYTTLDLLNIATRGVDDDGAKAGRPTPPEGYEDWLVKLSEAANQGIQPFEKAFSAADQKLRAFLTQSDALTLAKMRTRARTGKAATL